MSAIRLIPALILCSLLTGCSLGYLLKSGWYQAKLLQGAEPIVDVLERGSVTGSQRKKLQLILSIREFSEKTLHLDIGKNYTTINLAWKHSIYNVSASEALAFKPHLWCFLIVGCFPQKGHFVEADARAEAEYLKEQGLDVAQRIVGGYSSLGFFRDPVWPQMLERSDGSLADLIIHELSHRTLFFNDKMNFNESFANFVGKKGAQQFLADYYGEESVELKQYQASLRDEEKYVQYMWDIVAKLDKVYEGTGAADEKRAEKEQIISNGMNQLSDLPFETDAYKNAKPVGWNNASLMTFKVYNSSMDEFEDLFDCFEGDWKSWLAELRAFKSANDPLNLLKQRIEEMKQSGECKKGL